MNEKTRLAVSLGVGIPLAGVGIYGAYRLVKYVKNSPGLFDWLGNSLFGDPSKYSDRAGKEYTEGVDWDNSATDGTNNPSSSNKPVLNSSILAQVTQIKNDIGQNAGSPAPITFNTKGGMRLRSNIRDKVTAVMNACNDSQVTLICNDLVQKINAFKGKVITTQIRDNMYTCFGLCDRITEYLKANYKFR